MLRDNFPLPWQISHITWQVQTLPPTVTSSSITVPAPLHSEHFDWNLDLSFMVNLLKTKNPAFLRAGIRTSTLLCLTSAGTERQRVWDPSSYREGCSGMELRQAIQLWSPHDHFYPPDLSTQLLSINTGATREKWFICSKMSKNVRLKKNSQREIYCVD